MRYSMLGQITLICIGVFMLRLFCASLLLLPGLLLGVGVQAASCDPALEQQMASLSAMVQSDPVATANSAIANRHYGFLGVAGYALSLPGIDVQACRVQKIPVQILPGTGDVVCGKPHRELIEQANRYAETFNTTMKAHLLAIGRLHCSSDL